MKIAHTRVLIPLACVLLVLAGCAATDAVRSSDIQESLQRMIETKYSQIQTNYELPPDLGMLLFLDTPTGEFSVQAGFSGVRYDENTHYRIASVSKTFTAAAIMLLDQEGALDIDDTVADTISQKEERYLPDTDEYDIPFKDRMTIKHLLSHRAGVFDVFNDPIPPESEGVYAGMSYIEYVLENAGEEAHQFTLDELASVLAKDKLTYGEPGSLYHYSDSGYMLLASIIERVSGMSYSRFLEEHFFTPLGLDHTSSVHLADDTNLPDPHFTGYSRWDAEYFDTTEDNMTSNIGAGNIISTPRDMAHWIKALVSGQGPLTRTQVEKMKVVPEGNSTYGLGLSSTSVGIGHSGAHPGYLNFVQYNEEHDVSVVLVAPFIDYNEGNMDHIAATSELMMDVMESALLLYGES
jgi:D-alanyl-D-alanine carboxypeptidase